VHQELHRFLFVTVTSRKQQSSQKQALTPDDGQFRPKHVVVLKILKILKVTSVENTEKCPKTLTSRKKDGEEK
jgi:hypothetical protein